MERAVEMRLCPEAERAIVGPHAEGSGWPAAMRRCDAGVWPAFATDVDPGALYRFEIGKRAGRVQLKADHIVVACNFTPIVRFGYRIGVLRPGRYIERLNSDCRHCGGANVGNEGGAEAEPIAANSHPFCLSLTLPPPAAFVLQPAEGPARPGPA